MKRSKVIVQVSDGKETRIVNGDVLIDELRGQAHLVWQWGRKDGEADDAPIAFTTVPIVSLKSAPPPIEGYIHERPIFLKSLDILRPGWLPPDAK